MEKYGITRKSIYSALSVLACASIVIVTSVAQAYFNPEKLKTIAYWINLLVLISISIFSMIAGQRSGDDVSRNLPNGRYRISLGMYMIIIQTIKDLGLYAYIGDWLELYRRRKLEEKISMILNDNGIKQLEVLDLSFTELNELLKEGYRKDWTHTPFRAKYHKEGANISREDEDCTDFVSYTKEQIEIIRAVKEGKVKVSKLPSTFFVSAFSQSEKDEWESSANAAKKKGLYLGVNLTYRVIGMALLSVMLTGLEVMANPDAQAKANMWVDIVTKLATLIMSYIWGIFVGFNLVNIDNEYLDFKVSIMNIFVEEYKNGRYKIETVEEKAKKAHEERIKRENGQIVTVPGQVAIEV